MSYLEISEALDAHFARIAEPEDVNEEQFQVMFFLDLYRKAGKLPSSPESVLDMLCAILSEESIPVSKSTRSVFLDCHLKLELSTRFLNSNPRELPSSQLELAQQVLMNAQEHASKLKHGEDIVNAACLLARQALAGLNAEDSSDSRSVEQDEELMITMINKAIEDQLAKKEQCMKDASLALQLHEQEAQHSAQMQKDLELAQYLKQQEEQHQADRERAQSQTRPRRRNKRCNCE